MPVTAASVIVSTCAVAGGVVQLRSGIGVCAFGLTVFLLSTLVHELAHLYIIKRDGKRAAVLQRGMRLAILHPSLSKEVEMSSALLGPAAGIATGMIGGLYGLVYSPLLGLLGLAIGLFHLVGLLPWYGDGASLHRAMHTRGVET